jgi:hypothetical protein
MDDTVCDNLKPLVIDQSLALRNRRRARRVVILLTTVFLLGLGDLYATITHATTVGMIEVNPIGAYLLNADSIPGLILFKLGTMGIGVGLLLRVRHKLQSELSSWLILAVMVALTLHWANYNEAVAKDYQRVSHARAAMAPTSLVVK